MNAQQLSQVAFFLSSLLLSFSLLLSLSLLFLFAFCIVIAISKADVEGRGGAAAGAGSYGPKWQIKCYQEADTWHIVARITQS